MGAFWDTSAVIKLYVDEPDARLVRSLARRPESLFISAFTVHELHCGLHRKEALKALRPGMAEVLYRAFRKEIEAEYFRLVAYSSRVEQQALEIVRKCYEAPKSVFIRVLDVLQLASAFAADATDLVSTDKRMRQAARFVGLKVFPEFE